MTKSHFRRKEVSSHFYIMAERLLTSTYCGQFFPESQGFNFQVVKPDFVDRRPTVKGKKWRCIDRRDGMSEDGYNPDNVQDAPATPGAAEGLAIMAKNGLVVAGVDIDCGNFENYLSWADRAIRRLGYEPSKHGDKLLKARGCAFNRSVEDGIFEGLEPLTSFEREFMDIKLGTHYTELYPNACDPEGFALNPKMHSTIRPDGGRFYPVDIWAMYRMGILSDEFMKITAKCAELLLHEGQKNIYYVEG